MRLPLIALLAVAAALSLSTAPSAAEEPEVTLIYPGEGAVLAERPPVIRMCFADPIDIRDLDAGGDFEFGVVSPDERRPGLRISFQPDGLGVDIFVGELEAVPEGEWTFGWLVLDAETGAAATGTTSFVVVAQGSPVPDEPPQACPGSQTPNAGASPSPAADGRGRGSDDGVDVLVVVLAVGGPSLGAFALALFLYRRLRGRRWRHPPP